MDEIFSVGIPVISEIEFVVEDMTAPRKYALPKIRKTTTTSIIYFLMKNAGLNVGLAGNIGQSYAFRVATKKHDYYVLELSSLHV